MSKLADPTICPDCRAVLRPDGTCSGCGLPLGGPLGAELWQTMLRADALVERLRRTPAPAPAVGAASGPTAPAATPPARARRLPSASVPLVLLGLGGLCLLVSAVVFVAVTWSSLGIGARTAILAGVTALFAGAAAAVTRRGLRWAAETLWLVVCGMAALDLLGARSAGLLGLDRLDARHATALLGLLELAVGAAAAAWSAPRATARLTGPQVVAGLGVLLVTGSEAWSADSAAVATALAVPALAAVVLLVRRLLPWTAAVAGAVAALSWLLLVGHGGERWHDSVGDPAWWSTVEGWPLLAAAGFAGALAQARRIDNLLDGALEGIGTLVRSSAAGAALAGTGLLVVGPLDAPTRDLLLGSAVVVALGSLARVSSPVWSRPAAALSAVGAGVLSAWLVARPWAVLTLLPSDGHLDPGAALPVVSAAGLGGVAPWATIPVAAAVLAACWASAGALPPAARLLVIGGALPAVAPAAAGLAAATLVLSTGVPVGVAALAFAVALAAAGAGAAWQQGRPEIELLAASAFVAVAAPTLRLALASDPVTAALTSLLAVALLVGHRLLRPGLLWGAGTTLLAAVGTLDGAVAVSAWCRVAGASPATQAFTLAGYAAVLGLAARFVGRDAIGRAAIELSALAVGLGAAAVAPTTADAALVATVVGTAVCLVSVLDAGRPGVAWLGAGVLAAATLLRVLAHVDAPEVVSLPGAALLLGAGAWRMSRNPALPSLTMLGSGLSLGLTPSLLLALDEPISLRGVLVGVAGVVALAVGVAGRWSAPFLAGAVTTAVLAVRHLGPVADALPRWVTFGAVGLALLVVGITWEARRRDLAAAAHYLAALR